MDRSLLSRPVTKLSRSTAVTTPNTICFKIGEPSVKSGVKERVVKMMKRIKQNVWLYCMQVVQLSGANSTNSEETNCLFLHDLPGCKAPQHVILCRSGWIFLNRTNKLCIDFVYYQSVWKICFMFDMKGILFASHYDWSDLTVLDFSRIYW